MKYLSLPFFASLSLLAQNPHDHANCQAHGCSSTAEKQNDINLGALLTIDSVFESHGDRASEALGEIEGFGHAHEDEHDHSGSEDGVKWRHAELELSATYKDYISLNTVLGFSEDEQEIEELFLQTHALPYGFGLKLGQFRSSIGIYNQRHLHSLDFTNQNLNTLAFFGDHGIQEKGVQLTWNIPEVEGLLLGVEILEGETEGFAEEVSAQGVKKHDNPNIWTTFAKYQHDIDEKHYFTYGFTYAQAKHQEAHDEDENEVNDHFFDGNSYLYGADFSYFFDNGREDGQGDFSFEMEYFRRNKELTVVRHDLEADAVGLTQTNRQDGISAQALYTFIPNFRAGARFEALGLTNDVQEEAGEDTEKAPASYRSSLMADAILAKHNLIRFQVSHYDITTHAGDEDFWTFTAQWQFTFGAQKGFKL